MYFMHSINSVHTHQSQSRNSYHPQGKYFSVYPSEFLAEKGKLSNTPGEMAHVTTLNLCLQLQTKERQGAGEGDQGGYQEKNKKQGYVCY